MWQKEQGEAEKLIVGQVLGYQPAFAMLMLTSPRHCEVNCSVPAHPACTWPSFWAALPAGKPPCLTTRIKGSPSSTCALGWHGRGCQLAGQPLLVTGGTLSLNHPGHPYSVHLAPCPSHLELPLSSISDHLVQLSLVLCWSDFLSVMLDREVPTTPSLSRVASDGCCSVWPLSLARLCQDPGWCLKHGVAPLKPIFWTNLSSFPKGLHESSPILIPTWVLE